MKLQSVCLILVCLVQLGRSTTCNLHPKVNSSCRVLGKINFGHQLDYAYSNSQVVKTLEECARLCARRSQGSSGCQSFEFYQYDKDTTVCTLGSYSVKNSIHKMTTSRKTYYDVGCFDCGHRCDQAIGSNLIDNGDFEQELLGPWDVYQGGFGSGENSTRGFSSQTGAHYNNFKCNLLQGINTCPQHLHAFEFDFKLKNNSYPHEEQLYLEGPMRGKWILKGRGNAVDQSWRKARGALGSDAHDYIRFANYGDSRYSAFSIDNVKIARIPQKFSSQSVIRNGGFESGALAPWYNTLAAESHAVLRSPGLNNTSYAVFVRANKESSITQNITTTPNTLYEFSYDTNTTKSRAITNCLINVNIPNIEGITPGTEVKLKRHIPQPGFYSFKEYFYTTASQITLTFRVYCRYGTNSDLTYDNLRMVAFEGDPFNYLK